MGRKYMIRCDMEGVTGVVSNQQVEPQKPEYIFGQTMLMKELLCLVEELHKGDTDKIVVYDEHYFGRSINLSELPNYVSVICGKPPYRPEWAGGLDTSFTGVILLGFHSKAGTPNGLLPHSYEYDNKDLRINNVSVGEIGIEAAIAGDFKVPVLFVVGDSAGISEAKSLLPGIEGVIVKESLGINSALCYPISETKQRIRIAAKKIAGNPNIGEVYYCGKNVTLEVELNDTPFCKVMNEMFHHDILNSNTVILKGGSVTEVWAEYLKRKLICQKQLTDI